MPVLCVPRPLSCYRRPSAVVHTPALHDGHSPLGEAEKMSATMRPYRPSASAKMRIRIIPTNNLGCCPNALVPMSPTMPIATPAASPLNPPARPAAKFEAAAKSVYCGFIDPSTIMGALTANERGWARASDTCATVRPTSNPQLSPDCPLLNTSFVSAPCGPLNSPPFCIVSCRPAAVHAPVQALL